MTGIGGNRGFRLNFMGLINGRSNQHSGLSAQGTRLFALNKNNFRFTHSENIPITQNHRRGKPCATNKGAIRAAHIRQPEPILALADFSVQT